MKKLIIINLILLTFILPATAQTRSHKKPAARRAKPKAVAAKPAPPLPATTTNDLGSGTGGGTGNGVGTGTGSGIGQGSGRGVGSGDGSGAGNVAKPLPPVPDSQGDRALVIINIPHAEMTEESRHNQVSGTVTLRVTFLSSGKIGDISVVSGLADGLTQNAVDAAKQITFEPALKNNQPITVTKNVKFSFAIY